MSAVNKDRQAPDTDMFVAPLHVHRQDRLFLYQLRRRQNILLTWLVLQFIDFLDDLFRIKVMHHGAKRY